MKPDPRTTPPQLQSKNDPAPGLFEATVIISTRNRKEDLRRAVASVLRQSVPVELIVIDDASTDGTSEMLAADFPTVRMHRSESSLGYIVQRNRGTAFASAPVVISMDDDAEFVSPHTVRQTLADFDDPRVGAVAIPYIDVGRSSEPRQSAPSSEGVFAANNFRGTAGAVRRDLFLKLGGYKEYFFHQGEEDEFCLRLLQAGYITRLGRADALHHFESPKRDKTRIFLHQARNNLLFAWYNVPVLWLPVHLTATAVNCLRAGFRAGYGNASLRGCGRGLMGILHEWSKRQPVSPAVYRLLRRLKKSGPLLLQEVERALPPVSGDSTLAA
jgi:GT2 family glycosyltransferase